MLTYIAVLICFVSSWAVIIAVLWDFVRFYSRHSNKEKKSFIATWSMFLFFFLYLAVIVNKIGYIKIEYSFREILSFIGSMLVLLGAYVNIKGRIDLGRQWADQIKIYDDHKLITDGVYKYVRHPLYASLIWMFFGGALVFTNWLAFLLNCFIFIPMMYLRAKQEEALLEKTFPEYGDYKKRVKMFGFLV